MSGDESVSPNARANANAYGEDDHSRLGWLVIALGIGGAVLVALTVHGSMPRNAIDSSTSRDLQTTAWAPQSWKFFTRNPQEEIVRPVLLARRNANGRKANDETWGAASSPDASPHFAFGLDREGRAQGVEIGLLLEGLPPSSYHSCEEGTTPENCLSKQTKILKLENHTPHPTLCGHVGLIAQKPVPWAWARSGRTIVMPSRVLRLEVKCG